MEAEGITFGLNALMSILFGVAGAVGFWFKIKGSVNLLEQRKQKKIKLMSEFQRQK